MTREGQFMRRVIRALAVIGALSLLGVIGGLIPLCVLARGVEGNSHWCTDSREIALLEVGSDALAEAIGAPRARGIERGLGTWEGCGFVLPSGGDPKLIRYRQSPRPPGVRLPHWPLGRCECHAVEVLAALKLLSSMRYVGGS
jgi:hypothetical protein